LTQRYFELAFSHEYAMEMQWLVSGGRTSFIQDANNLLMKKPDLVDVLKSFRKTVPSSNGWPPMQEVTRWPEDRWKS